MLTTCRAAPDFDVGNPYKGKEVTFNLTIDREDTRAKVIGDIYECVLWYFQFRKITDPVNVESQYLGVMDIDINRDEGMNDQEYELKKMHYLPVLVDKLHRMNYHSYRIFISGTKGYHVYIFEEKLWVIPQGSVTNHNLWLEEQVKRLYPDIYEELDMNIYHINKGIRNPLYPHPKTHRVCRQVKEKNAPACVWDWLIDFVHVRLPVPVMFLNSIPLQNNKVNREQIISRSIYSQDSIISQLESIFNNAKINFRSGTLYVPDTKYCPIKKAEHKSKGKCYINVFAEHAIVKCHHGNCSSSQITVCKKERPLTDFAHVQETMFDKGTIKTRTRALRTINPSIQKHVLSEDIDWVLGDTGLGIVSAPMGAGKTTSVIDWIEKEKTKRSQLPDQEPFRVILLVTRVTQAMNFGSKYPGMVSYLDVEGSLSNQECSVLCINSLVRVVSQENGHIKSCDLLILDEIEALIECLVGQQLSNGLSKQCNIWQLFRALIVSARRVLFMDGILTERTAKYLDSMGILELCNLLQHEGQPDYREYINFRSGGTFEEAFDLDCRSGKKVVIVSNSKSLLYMYAGRGASYGNSNLIITGDSTKAEKMTATDPNEEWTKNILGFNTAVGPGASYDEVHYDVMYVLCSTVSCTPYSLYQMINRIRTLKDKTVKMFILYQENRTIPSREELKKTKTTNIVKMHSKQNDYVFPLDFYQKIGTDYIKLDINTTNYTVLKKIIQEEQLVLYHEDNNFIETLVDYEYEKLRFNDTEYYTKVLFDIIRRNGGIVKGLTDYSDISEGDKKNLRNSSRMVRTEGTKNYKELALSSDNLLTKTLPANIDMDYKSTINRHVQLNDVDTHIRWCTFRRAIRGSEMSVYEKELESVNTKRKAINNTLIYSTGLLDSLNVISEICGFRINRALGTIEGGGTYSNFTDKHGDVDRELRRIDDQLYNGTKRRLEYKVLKKDKRMPKDTTTFKNLRTMFSQFGINLVLDEGRAKKICEPSNKAVRFFDKSYQICLYSQYLRMAFSGLAFDTGLPIEDPFNYLKANYKKI